jgi:hypothetical protein
MDPAIADFFRRPDAGVLNRVLYGLLLERFGRVEVASPGEAAIPGPVSVNPRTHRIEASFSLLGEYYKICCPYCNDRRIRLYVNHLWCTPSPADGEPLWHLATCYNEGCLAEKYRDFHERVWGWQNASARAAMKKMRVDPGIVFDRPLSTAPMPGECFRVDELEKTHPAVAYLEDRGFDVRELGETWDVAFCKRAEGIYANAGRRIVIPIQSQALRVGWQARYVGEIDWKHTGVPGNRWLDIPRGAQSPTRRHRLRGRGPEGRRAGRPGHERHGGCPGPRHQGRNGQGGPSSRPQRSPRSCEGCRLAGPGRPC